VKTAQLNRRQAVQLVETALALGLRHAVLSPGARNTPIVLALHDAHQAGQDITLHSVIDERAAGFFALGIARRTDTPVLLSCTSGSAAANYFPAIVEASAGQVPLLVITADRPAELQDCGAPQAMPQVDLYGTHARYSVSLEAPEDREDIATVAKATQMAWQAATGLAPGPAHINLRFRKPLWTPDAVPFTPVAIGSSNAQRPTLSQTEFIRLQEEINHRRGVIVVGTDASQRVPPQAVIRLATALGWPILADPVNSLRFGMEGPIVRHHDALLRSESFQTKQQPEIALVIGGTTSSRPLETMLRSTPSIVINDTDRNWNPWGSVRWTLKADIGQVADALEDAQPRPTPLDGSWCADWLSADAAAKMAIQSACSQDLWEGSIAHHMVANLPHNALLRIASSMPIRDIDGFAVDSGVAIDVSSNRGVNGIDGTIATTFGEAAVHEGPVAVLMGDLSFIHDAASLLTAPHPRQPTVLTVVNNGGGGIFGFLPMKDHPTGFEPWYITPHDHDIHAISTAAGVRVSEPETLTEYVDALTLALHSPGVTLLHIRVDREQSTQRHHNVWSAICQAVDGAL